MEKEPTPEDEEEVVIVGYRLPKLYGRPLRPYEKAYMFWFIESLKPPHKRNKQVMDQKYIVCGIDTCRGVKI